MPAGLDWDKLRSFNAAAETGSLTSAAELLRVSQSAVSRQLSALEDQIGAPLFHRHARGLTLTEQGRILYKTTRDVSHQIALAQAQVNNSQDKPAGTLRVSTPISLGSNWLTSVIPEFLEAYPEINVQILLEDAEHDLSSFDVDCALRPWPTLEGDVIQKELGRISQSLYASQSYLAQYGAPKSLQDLDNHRVLGFGDMSPPKLNNADWALKVGREGQAPRNPIIALNNLHGIMRAAEAGIGICGIPDYMIAMSRRLVRVLPDVRGADFDVFFVYPTELRGSTKAKVFRDFLVRVTRDWREKSPST